MKDHAIEELMDMLMDTMPAEPAGNPPGWAELMEQLVGATEDRGTRKAGARPMVEQPQAGRDAARNKSKKRAQKRRERKARKMQRRGR